MFKLDLEKAEELEIKLSTSFGSLKKQEGSKKTSALLTTPKPLSVCITTNWKILEEMGIPDHLTCFLRNLYAGQEAAVRTGHKQHSSSKSGKEYVKAVYCHPSYLDAEYIMRNSGLDEAEAGIKIAGRNINNLKYADDTTLMA